MIKTTNAILFLLFITQVIAAKTRVITDMAGRQVTIPATIERILPHDEKTSIFLFPVAGDKMISRGIKRDDNSEIMYISKRYTNLPVSDILNVEEILKLKPDIIVTGCFIPEDYSRYERLSAKTQIPVIIIDLNLNRLTDSYKFIGSLFGNETKANACIIYLNNFFKDFNALKNSNKKNNSSVYLAVGKAGLQSAPSGSKHVQLFDELGLRNVVQSEIPAKGFTQVSIEQIINWKPDYIFTIDKGKNDPYTEIRSSALWKTIPAVQNNHVFHVPEEPFNWFGNPPSVNLIPGMIFLSEFFYQKPQKEAHRQIIEFYKLFYDYPLTETDLVKLLKSN